ncbi:hypothetical protein HRI_001360400 [Hibiscus trionum]|uniref:Conserved Oligomeric Golgi complex subunit 6 C-terminal domain-containing protein n=1 Tax=Hibiscus trionum TaxID=183268 RepID=A0A9W7LV20_HIBTR|nr:hypothetical protein HRI_001360400 [Hibiscus trionum]
MAMYQEGAYERLCRWVQAECRKLGDTDNPEVGDLLKTAVRCLKEMPVLFKYCAEEVTSLSQNLLSSVGQSCYTTSITILGCFLRAVYVAWWSVV